MKSLQKLIKMKNQFIVIALILLGFSTVSAQNATLFIKNQNNINKLYWVANSFEPWFDGLQNGYFVEKRSENGSYVRLNKEPLFDAAWQKQAELTENENHNFIVRLSERQKSIPKLLSDEEGFAELQMAYGMYLLLLLEKPEHYKTLGNYFEDKSGKTNDAYRIVINNANQTALNTKTNLIKPEKAAQALGKTNLYHNSFGEIFIKWHNDSLNFSAYSIERSLNGAPFEKVNQFPLLPDPDKRDTIAYVDSIGPLTAKLQYRITAYDAFGQLHALKPVDYQLKDEQAPSVAELSYAISNKESRTVSLSWKKDFVENDFVGYNLYRSTSLDTIGLKLNKELIQKSKIAELDIVPENESLVYYTMGTLDFAGNESFSNKVQVVIPDKTPPAVPKNLKALVDDIGVVSLAWENNSERDLMGYKLFASSQQNEGFVAISANHVRTNQTYDTLALNISNREYFYKILAFDSNFNASVMSDAIQVLRPDTIAPQTPILLNPIITDSSVFLPILHGGEDDLQAIYIFSKKDEKEDWTLLSKSTEFKDSLLNMPYEIALYRAYAQDKNGNMSPFSAEKYVYVKPKIQISAPVYNVNATVQTDSVSLVWEQDSQELKSLYYIFILSEKADAVPQLIGSTSLKSYVLYKHDVPKTFKLFVVSLNEQNRTSMPSEIVSVSF